MVQWKTSNFWLNKRHKFVCGLNNLSFVTYHDMFAGEYQVGYGRFHCVEKLHASSYINGESQCLILIHNYTYDTHKYIVAIYNLYLQGWIKRKAIFFFLQTVIYCISQSHDFNTSFLNDKKNPWHMFYLFLHVRH